MMSQYNGTISENDMKVIANGVGNIIDTAKNGVSISFRTDDGRIQRADGGHDSTSTSVFAEKVGNNKVKVNSFKTVGFNDQVTHHDVIMSKNQFLNTFLSKETKFYLGQGINVSNVK